MARVPVVRATGFIFVAALGVAGLVEQAVAFDTIHP